MAVELIQNGSFEVDGFSSRRLYTHWDDGSGRGFNVLEYEPEMPGTATRVPAGRGDLFAYAFSSGAEVGGEVHWQGFAEQHVDIAPFSGAQFEFQAWLGGRRGEDGDYPIVTLGFFSDVNATGELLRSIVFHGNDQETHYIVGSANDHGFADPTILATQDNWTLYSASGSVPESAVSAAIIIRGDSANVTGFVNHGTVDLVSLRVIPEPGTLLLSLIGVGSALLLIRHGKVTTAV